MFDSAVGADPMPGVMSERLKKVDGVVSVRLIYVRIDFWKGKLINNIGSIKNGNHGFTVLYLKLIYTYRQIIKCFATLTK